MLAAIHGSGHLALDTKAGKRELAGLYCNAVSAPVTQRDTKFAVNAMLFKA